MTPVAIVHDYLTQRRGAERVVLAMSRAFPEAPIYTSLYLAEATFPEFADREVHTTALDRVAPLRRHHRLGLPVYGMTFSAMEIDAEVVICSSSGWAHAARTRGRKVIYCYTPARWLYQPELYLQEDEVFKRVALGALRPWLLRWDGKAARSAHRYLAISTEVRERIERAYGVGTEVLHPPHTVRTDAPRETVEGIEPGFVLCISRRRPYKNMEEVVEAFAAVPEARLVVVGSVPSRHEASGNVRFVGSPSDPQLHWLYANCAGVVTASYEDFGLVPVEAAGFGKPTAALDWGGHRDTVLDGETGVLFSEPSPLHIAMAVRRLLTSEWDAGRLRLHAEHFSEERFSTRLRAIVEEERQLARHASPE